MAASIPLPRKVRQMIDATRMPHPGLALDKYAMSHLAGADAATFQKEVQRPAIERVALLSKAFAPDGPEGLSLKVLLARRQGMLEDLGATFLRCETTSPLTLHLARASALENAGICLHQVYGFVYLPGSGLKGMARAFAEKVWLPAQGDTAVARASLLAVFGNEQRAAENHAGGVVFHDAWPETWPVLQTDIVNNHHSGYYGGNDAPGDWDDPIPVNFLSVIPGTSFSFALSCRRQDTIELFSLAQTFLMGALCHLGAGAKTNAGYGCFRPLASSPPELPVVARQAFETTLELVTPAFLAGADQQAEDCQLRGATVRGLLRWWWRTLHAGHVDVNSLREMEAAIWGDTKASGAVRLEVGPEEGFAPPERYEAVNL